MAGAVNEIRLKGQKELERSFKQMRKEVLKSIRTDVRKLATPVQRDAQQRALDEIPNIGQAWSRLRLGVLVSGVYLAPRERGRRSRAIAELRRPNLVDLMMTRALIPAFEAHQAELMQGFSRIIDDASKKSGLA